MKGFERLDQEAVEEFSHTNIQDFTQAGSAPADDQPAPDTQSQKDIDYEAFIQKVGAIATRRGSYQEIADLLGNYPSLGSQAQKLMDDVREAYPDLPEDQAAVDAEVQATNQSIAGILGVGGQDEEKDDNTMVKVAAALVGATAVGGMLAGLFGGENEKYKQGASALLGANEG